MFDSKQHGTPSYSLMLVAGLPKTPHSGGQVLLPSYLPVLQLA